jgi:GNAT superfamily N-acetyltransferase
VAMSVVIRKADSPDARPLAAVLARAFLDDPLMRFILPDEGARRRRLPRLFRISLGVQYLPVGEVYTTSERAGASLWSPPGRWRAPPSIVIRTLPRLALALGTRLPISVRAISTVEAAHPTEPHWYLAVVGTEPSLQGRGIGSALLAPILQRCDHDAMPAYLESSKEANLAFYARHGFEVTKAIDLGRGGPRIWPMWREPRP